MKAKFLILAAAMWVVGCESSSPPAAQQTEEASIRPEPGKDTRRAVSQGMSLLNTTWEFSDDAGKLIITINADGSFIEKRANGALANHGTYRQTRDQDCFTSAMEGKGTSCWTVVPQTEIGKTASASDENGETAVFTRVAFRPLTLAD